MNKTSLLMFFLVLSVSLMSSGCGNADNSPIRVGVEAPSNSNDLTEIVTLKVSGYKSGSEIGAIPELNRKFMDENPNIKVDYQGMPGGQFTEYIKTRFAVNDASDVIMMHPGLGEIGIHSRSGYLLELTDEPWLKVFSPSALTAVTYDNKVYGIPNDMAVIGVYYNKRIYKQLNLEIPRNWSEFLAACMKLKAAGITPISIGNNDGWMTLAALYSMWPSINEDVNFDLKLNARTIQYNGTWNGIVAQWYDLNDKGYLTPNSVNVSLDKAQSDFAKEQAAMYIDGSWSMAGIVQKNPELEFGMFPMPANSAEQEIVVSAAIGTSWAINKRTSNLAAAKLYLAFWSKAENLKIWTKSQDAFITLNGVESEAAPQLSEISRALSVGKTFPFLDQGWEQAEALQNELKRSAQGVYLQAMSQEQMLINMDNAWDKAAIDQ